MDASDWLGDVREPRNVGGRPAKDYAARGNRKLECPTCGFIARCSIGALRKAGGLPSCACGETLELVELRDRAAYDWDAVERDLAGLDRVAYNDAMRELGFDSMIIPAYNDRRGGLAPARCQWEGGYCAKFTSRRYCPEHEHERPAMGSAYKGRA